VPVKDIQLIDIESYTGSQEPTHAGEPQESSLPKNGKNGGGRIIRKPFLLETLRKLGISGRS
jgi:hypothetical protein